MMYYVFNIFILLTHLLLLGWIIFVLQKAGAWAFTSVMLHFMGLALYGTLLIILSAKGIKYFHLKELKSKNLKRNAS